jgi:hypothetical protein
MSTHQFLTNENLQLLWDVFMDNDSIKNKSRENLIQINNLFNQNIKGFYEQEMNLNKSGISLIELNKKFITLFINHIQKTFSKSNNNKQAFITVEEIQNHRQNQFEKELTMKQQEFTNAMALPVPPTPTFQDKIDEPISELELEIKRTIAQRNYDIEKIQNNIHNVTGDPTSWLTSQETSVKKEKLNFSSKSLTNNKSVPEIKYIKIENNLDNNILKNDIVDLNINTNNINANPKKNVQWADETEDVLETDLFKKLKMLPQKEESEKLVERMEKMEFKLTKIEQMLEQFININKNENKSA